MYIHISWSMKRAKAAMPTIRKNVLRPAETASPQVTSQNGRHQQSGFNMIQSTAPLVERWQRFRISRTLKHPKCPGYSMGQCSCSKANLGGLRVLEKLHNKDSKANSKAKHQSPCPIDFGFLIKLSAQLPQLESHPSTILIQKSWYCLLFKEIAFFPCGHTIKQLDNAIN